MSHMIVFWYQRGKQKGLLLFHLSLSHYTADLQEAAMTPLEGSLPQTFATFYGNCFMTKYSSCLSSSSSSFSAVRL